MLQLNKEQTDEIINNLGGIYNVLSELDIKSTEKNINILFGANNTLKKIINDINKNIKEDDKKENK